MRIIAGSARGVRLTGVPRGVRPVADRAREGLFSSLGGAVAGARVLDLYAGTGALGIEALSRGARAATFVDRDPGATRAVRENLERAHLADRARVVRSEVLRFLRRTDPPEDVDLVFLDPPYATPVDEIAAVLEALSGRWITGEGWTVVLTRPRKGSTPVIPLHWRLARRLGYGDSLVLCYREGSWA